MVKTEETGNRRISDYIVTAIMALSFYFSQYMSFIPGLTVGELLLITGSVIIIVKNNFKLRLVNTAIILVYFLVALFSSVIAIILAKISFSMTSRSEVIFRWIRYFAYVLFMVIYCDNYLGHNNYGACLIRVYKIIACAFAIYGIVQFIAYITLKVFLPVNILSLKMSGEVDTEVLLNNANNYSMRVQGVFSEPGYFAKFLLPGVAFSLLGWESEITADNKIDWRTFLLFTIAIVFSGSVQGILLMLLVFLLAFLITKRLSNRQLLYFTFFAVIVAIGIMLIIRSGLFTGSIQRIKNLVSGNPLDRSAQLRIYRGFEYWKALPFEHKIFGVGMGNAANYANQYNIVTEFDHYIRNEATLEYMSGISSILVTHGIFCLIIFIVMIMRFKNILNRKGLVILLIFVASLFGGGSFLSVLGVMHFSLACSCLEQNLEV